MSFTTVVRSLPKNSTMAYVFLLALVILSASQVLATDPNQLQDFCIVDKNSPVYMNGFPCKDPKLATVDDFSSSGLHNKPNITNPLGYRVTPVTPNQIPGLNTLGISIARIDFASNGLNPPHIHPRSTEIITVLEGSLYVGFVTSGSDYKLFAKTLKKGDVFVFPQGLVHFQYNNCTRRNTVIISALSSQFPGVTNVGDALLNAKPPVPREILEKTLGKNIFRVSDDEMATD